MEIGFPVLALNSRLRRDAPPGSWRLDFVQPFHGLVGCANLFSTALRRRCGEQAACHIQVPSLALCGIVRNPHVFFDALPF